MLLAAVLVVAGGSGSKATGARGASRPMDFPRQLHLAVRGECFLRLSSKLRSDGVPAGHGFAEIDSGGAWRCSAEAESDSQRF